MLYFRISYLPHERILSGAWEKEWIEQLENNVDDEHEYTYLAYREKPSTIDYESVPFGEKRHFCLDCVYDGFDECCKALNREVVLA